MSARNKRLTFFDRFFVQLLFRQESPRKHLRMPSSCRMEVRKKQKRVLESGYFMTAQCPTVSEFTSDFSYNSGSQLTGNCRKPFVRSTIVVVFYMD